MVISIPRQGFNLHQTTIASQEHLQDILYIKGSVPTWPPLQAPETLVDKAPFLDSHRVYLIPTRMRVFYELIQFAYYSCSSISNQQNIMIQQKSLVFCGLLKSPQSLQAMSQSWSLRCRIVSVLLFLSSVCKLLLDFSIYQD